MSAPPGASSAQPQPEEPRYTLILNTIAAVFLPAANNDPALARQAAIDALDEHGAVTMPEIDTAARAICLDHAAMDSLGKSMAPDLSETQRIRYRNQAVALTRVAERARDAFDTLRARRLTRESQAMAEAFFPARDEPEPQAKRPAPKTHPRSAPEPVPFFADLNNPPIGLQAMKRASRAMLADIQSRLADPGPAPPGSADSPPGRPERLPARSPRALTGADPREPLFRHHISGLTHDAAAHSAG